MIKLYANTQLLEMAKAGISLWNENVLSASSDKGAHSSYIEPEFIIYSDLSLLDWGVSCELGHRNKHGYHRTWAQSWVVWFLAGPFTKYRYVRMLVDNAIVTRKTVTGKPNRLVIFALIRGSGYLLHVHQVKRSYMRILNLGIWIGTIWHFMLFYPFASYIVLQ